jgi:hypothetical protein
MLDVLLIILREPPLIDLFFVRLIFVDRPVVAHVRGAPT